MVTNESKFKPPRLADRDPEAFVMRGEIRARFVEPTIETLFTVTITLPPKRKPFVILTGPDWEEAFRQVGLWIEMGCPSMEELHVAAVGPVKEEVPL